MPATHRTPADYLPAADCPAVQYPDCPPDNGAAYAAGYEAGGRWAEALASFTDLEQLEAEALAPFRAGRPFLRGFAAGALAAWNRMTTEGFTTTRTPSSAA